MTQAPVHGNADLPKLNWLAVLAAMTVAALAIYLVTSTVLSKLEAGRPARPAAPAAHAE